MAEALLLVRATRYNCADKESGVVSRPPFELLHRRYPASKWAKMKKCWAGQR